MVYYSVPRASYSYVSIRFEIPCVNTTSYSTIYKGKLSKGECINSVDLDRSPMIGIVMMPVSGIPPTATLSFHASLCLSQSLSVCLPASLYQLCYCLSLLVSHFSHSPTISYRPISFPVSIPASVCLSVSLSVSLPAPLTDFQCLSVISPTTSHSCISLSLSLPLSPSLSLTLPLSPSLSLTLSLSFSLSRVLVVLFTCACSLPLTLQCCIYTVC